MKKFLVILFIFNLTISLGYACEPCAEIYDFNASIREADLVILGKKNTDGPQTDTNGPDWIEVNIEHIFIGETSKEIITINSWDGMCLYGLNINDNLQHLMILKRIANDNYDAVFNGCGIKSYPIRDGEIIMKDKNISFEKFLEEISNADFQCFDIHGGNKCKRTHAADQQQRKQQIKLFEDNFTAQFRCLTDADCYPTKNGGCIGGSAVIEALNFLIDKENTQTSCRCLTGPVEYGCVPGK